MRQSWIERFDRRVPRYTSYPTAAQFGPLDPQTAEGWLSAIPADDALSLYLHVPFCRQLCWFCGCSTRVVRDPAVHDAYTDMLLAEIAFAAAQLRTRRGVKHVHWGGGTPAMLGADNLARVMAGLADHFTLLPDAELAIELDPRTAGSDVIARLPGMGFTRASLGLQDATHDVQAAINRIQSPDLLERVVGDLRAVGIDHISFDLIYGLPRQTDASVAASVDLAVRLGADRISVFGYAHVPWMRPHQQQIRDEDLPGTVARWRQMQTATDRLAEAGYAAIGIDHFARPDDPLTLMADAGALKRNFQGYTSDGGDWLLGFGASAISSLPGGFAQNAVDPLLWRDGVAAGHMPVNRGIAVSADDRLRADLIARLMCDLRVDLAAIAAAHGQSPDSLLLAPDLMDELVAEGVCHWSGWEVTVTPAARPFTRVVAACFDAHLDHATTRHATAV